jgi:hypothetical protein
VLCSASRDFHKRKPKKYSRHESPLHESFAQDFPAGILRSSQRLSGFALEQSRLGDG